MPVPSIQRQYETVILVRPDAAEAVQSTVRQRVGEIISNAGGRVVRWETWGKRRLAYEIAKQNKAFYLYSNYVTSQQAVREIERNLRILEPVLKYQTVRLAEEVDLDTFDFDKIGAERSPLYLSAEEAAAIERSYQREREWAAGGRHSEEGGPGPSDRPERSDRYDRSDRYERSDRPARSGPPERSDRPARSEPPAPAAAPAAPAAQPQPTKTDGEDQ